MEEAVSTKNETAFFMFPPSIRKDVHVSEKTFLCFPKKTYIFYEKHVPLFI